MKNTTLFVAVGFMFATGNAALAECQPPVKTDFKNGGIIYANEMKNNFECLLAELKTLKMQLAELEALKPKVVYYEQSFDGAGGIQMNTTLPPPHKYFLNSWVRGNNKLSINVAGEGYIHATMNGVFRNKWNNSHLDASVGIGVAKGSYLPSSVKVVNQITTVRSFYSHEDHTTPYKTQYVCKVPKKGSYTFYPLAKMTAGEKVDIGVHAITLQFIPGNNACGSGERCEKLEYCGNEN